MTSDGPLVAFRDRSAEEVRDVAVVRAEGAGWSEPHVVAEDGWQIHGCPVNGPAIAARGERVALAWFTAAQGRARVAVALSRDAGRTFTAPIEIDGAAPVGRVDVDLDDHDRAVVSWLGSDGEHGVIRLARVGPEGGTGPVETLVTTTVQRSTGVPRMVRRDGGLVLAWVEDEESGRVRMAWLPDV